MPVLTIRPLLLAAALLHLPVGSTPTADELQQCTRLTEWTPASVTGFAQARKTGPRLRSFLASGKLKRLLDSQLGKVYLQSDGYLEMMGNLSRLEEATGRKPLDLFDDLFGKDALLASRLTFAGGQEWLLLTRGKNKSALEAGRKALDAAIKANIGFPIQTKKTEHEGHSIEQLGEAWFTFLGDILAVSNSEKMVEEVIDLAYGRTEKSASRSPVYSKAPADDDFLARATIKPGFIPGIGAGLAGKMDEPVTSLLLSGIMGALRGCELMTISLDSSWSGIDLDLVLHPDDRGIAQKYSPFFPQTVDSEFESNIRKRKILGMVNLSRDFYQWWESSEEFLNSKAAGSLAQLSAALSMFMGGLNFQDEVLPQVGKTVSLVFRNQETGEGKPSPSPSIPGGALILELKDAGKKGRSFIVGFNSLVGIINFTRMQQDSNAPSMLVRPEKVAGVDCYRVDMGLPADPAEPGIEYNFSPTLAISGNRIILGSTFDLVKMLVEESEKTKKAGDTAVAAYARDQVYIDGKSAHSVFGKNLDFLAAQQVVEKGVNLAAAKAELKIIDELLSYIRGLQFESYRRKDSVHMDLKLGLITDTTIVEPTE
ncbi:MAG: hypothetical protein VCD34_03670 [Planctomycetota bacterium]